MSKVLNAVLSVVLILFTGVLAPDVALATTPSTVQSFSVFEITPSYPFISYQTLGFLRWIFGQRVRETDDDEFPADTASQGRRGPCNQVSQELIALVPPLSEPISRPDPDEIPSTEIGSSIEFTTQPTTKLWFYLPEHPDTVNRAELMIQNQQNQDIIAAPVSVALPSSEGAVSIDIATAGIALSVDTPYHWYISIVCNAERPSQNPSIDAWIQRISMPPELEAELASMTNPRDQVRFYIEQQAIWYDGLSLLAALRCRPSEDELLNEAWTSLLIDIGIQEKVANAPILSCPSAL